MTRASNSKIVFKEGDFYIRQYLPRNSRGLVLASPVFHIYHSKGGKSSFVVKFTELKDAIARCKFLLKTSGCKS